MSFDGLALSAQRAIDRLIRRLRRGAPPKPTHRRFLVVQIDGLSRAVLDEALASGRMPFLASCSSGISYRLEPMAVGLPTSTAAFQMAAMYGVRPDIPGFHYYDRRASWRHPLPAAGARGVGRGQAGRRAAGHPARRQRLRLRASRGAPKTTSSASPASRARRARRAPRALGLRRGGWVLVKCLTPDRCRDGEGGAWASSRIRGGRSARWRWLTIKIGISVWVRQFFTLAVSRDLYAGVPTIYVNYLDYDVAAHAFGPRQPAGHAVAAPGGQRDPSALAGGAPRARAPVRPLRPLRSRPGAVHAVPGPHAGAGGSSGGSSTSCWARAGAGAGGAPGRGSSRGSAAAAGERGGSSSTSSTTSTRTFSAGATPRRTSAMACE